jgi:hypothetical protein
MSTSPQDLAIARWGPIKKACEYIERAEAAHAASRTRVEQLRAEIGLAAHRDRQVLGEALVAGKSEPKSETVALRLELEQEERRAEALSTAVESARARIAAVVAENRPGWRAQATGSLARARSRYESAIVELEAARDALSDEAGLLAWLDSGAGTSAANDPLGGRIGPDRAGRPAMSFARVLEELRADAEAIAIHPVSREDPPAEPRFELAWRG